MAKKYKLTSKSDDCDYGYALVLNDIDTEDLQEKIYKVYEENPDLCVEEVFDELYEKYDIDICIDDDDCDEYLYV